MAADQGHPMGLNFLGCCFEFGKGVEKNEKEAFRYYKYIFKIVQFRLS